MAGKYRLVPATCEGCGAAFSARLCRVQKGQGRYCSSPCASRANAAKIDRTRKRGPLAADSPSRTHDAKKAAVGPWVTANAPLVSAFWERVARAGPDECWLWTGGRGADGYGLITKDGATWRATRVSWQLHNDEALGQRHVLHHCDNPPCVNPGHLWAGTRSDNMRDMVQKMRGWRQRATDCIHGHPFSEDNVYRDIKDGRPRRRCKTCMIEEQRRYRAKKSTSQTSSEPTYQSTTGEQST